jgi:putative CocE/NonD family hydrolase
MTVWIHRGVPVTMRDGIHLATDIYLPAPPGSVAPLPALLLRTPYDRTSRERMAEAEWFAGRGYAVVVQDCRGRFASEGVFRLGRGEAEDGYDSVEWVAGQPWCNGRVGTMGTSYMAWVQSALATLAPPHLAAMWVHEGIANGLKESVRQGGAFELRWMGWAFYGAATDPALDDETRRVLTGIDLRDWLNLFLPQPGASPLALSPDYERWYWEYLTTGTSGALWDSRGVNVERYWDEHADVPTVYSGGWYDSYTRATIRNFLGLTARKQSPQHLLMGPWTHGTKEPGLTYAGDVDFGPDAAVNFTDLRLQWFDYWLKGQGRPPLPRVRYFVMGGGSGRRRPDGRLDHGGTWCTSDTWPPAGAGTLRLYLSAGGRLTRETPAAAGEAAFRFDPRRPVPTLGGNISFLKFIQKVPPSLEEAPVADRLEHVSPIGGHNQVTFAGLFGAAPPYGPLAGRPDVVSFVTEPLPEPLLLCGPIAVRLWVSTDAPDTDFTAKLIDWYPPNADYPLGYALNLADGIQRLRFRAGYEAEQPMTPGSVVPIVIELYPSANYFPVGHRLRLDLSSSNFPRFDLNPNTGAPLGASRAWRVATNRIVWGPRYPGHLELTAVRP